MARFIGQGQGDTDMKNGTADRATSQYRDKSWYLVQCKPRQDERAEEHLTRQGYACYRPHCRRERLVRGHRQEATESLFPGYLFIHLASNDNWSPLRSTRGVNRVVSFGGRPIIVDDALIAQLQHRAEPSVEKMLQPGEAVRILEGSFAELDAIFLSMDGDDRVVLLMNLLNRQQQISLPLASIRVH
ncbi:transcriptional antiterminator RfaH [Pseudomonas indica]|uniref:Transcription antitermination protein RfaH n=2 Tax=Pseudomonas indica TaxID=137658 RepID=A0A1G8YQF9_9PSED|nr:transcriptional antiterminator RfaH [Pseudomonas indica]